jgi:hypothetical protein
MTLLYSFVFNNFCSESLSGDQTPNAQPPANFRLRRWQRKRDSAIELPIRRQRAGSGHRAPDSTTESRIRPQRAESRHRASDPVTKSQISLFPKTHANRVWVSGRTRSWVFRPDLSFSWPVLPFSWPDLSVFVAGSLFLCCRLYRELASIRDSGSGRRI